MSKFGKHRIRYSIRKYSVGVVSVFIGLGIYGVVNANDAFASEVVTDNVLTDVNNKENIVEQLDSSSAVDKENEKTIATRNVVDTTNNNLRSSSEITKVEKAKIPLDANNKVLIDTTNNTVANVKVIYTDGSSEVKTQDNTTTYVAKNRDNITEKVNTVKSSFETINYMDLYSAINNPYISSIDKNKIKSDLKKQEGSTPTEQRVEEIAKRNYMDALNMEHSFNKVKSNITEELTALFENSTYINTSNVIANKNKIMLGLTFLERQYGFDFNGVKAKDLILYYPEVFNRDGEALVNVVNIANMPAANLQLFRSAESYKNHISPIVNVSDVVSFVERGAGLFANKSGEQFFKDTTKASLVETTSEHGNTSLFSKMKKEDSLKNHLIPLLSLPSDSIYSISTTNTITYGLVDSYVDRNNENTKTKFLSDLNVTATHQQKFLDFWYRITTKKEELKKHNTIIVTDSLQKYSDNKSDTASSLWSAKTGNNAVNGVKEFITPMNYYLDYFNSDGMASGDRVVNYISKSLTERGQATYTHELTHILDKKIWFEGYNRRNGKGPEAFARGLFESINNRTFGGGYTKPVFNINSAYTLTENNRLQNATPERFQNAEDLKTYMERVFDVIYTLEYIEAKAILEKSNDDKAVLLNKISYASDNGDVVKNNDVFERITATEAANLNNINDLIINNIVSGRLEYQGNLTTGVAKQNGYYYVPLFEPIYAALQNNSSSPGDIAFKRNSYEILAEYGYKDGMAAYLSNRYANDGEALNAILDSKYNGNLAEFKKDMVARRIEKINDLKENEQFSNLDNLLSKMREAVDKDLAIMKANARSRSASALATGTNSVRKLKEDIFLSYLRSTNDFTESIYEQSQPRTIYVNNGNELSTSGFGSEQAPYESLRYAIEQARDGDTIKLVESVTTRTQGYTTTVGQNPTFVIDKAVTIDGGNKALTFRGFDLELTKNVEFKNVNLKLMPDGSQDTKIYLSGNEVTFNNVTTKVSDYPTQDAIRPTIVGGAKNGDPTGQHAKINIINGDSETRFKKIIAGDEDNDLYIPVTINIENQFTKVDQGIVLGGSNGNMTTEPVKVISNSRNISLIDASDAVSSEVELKNNIFNNLELINLTHVTLTDNAELTLNNTNQILGNLSVANGTKLWLNVEEIIVGNVKGDGTIVLSPNSHLNIQNNIEQPIVVKVNLQEAQMPGQVNHTYVTVLGTVNPNAIISLMNESTTYSIVKDEAENRFYLKENSTTKIPEPTQRKERINFDTIYRADDKLPFGESIVQDGSFGERTYTTTYSLGATGEIVATEDQGIETLAPKTKIVTKGTQPTTETTEQNYTTRYVGDNTKEVGYISERGGTVGTTSVTTTYKVNPQTGEVTAERGQPVIVNPVDKVITKGTKPLIETINGVAKNTVYKIDVNSNEVAGTKISETEGSNGYTTKTTTYTIDTDGNIIPSVNEVVTPKVDKVITISGKQKVEREVLEKGITYVADNAKDIDYINIVEGTNGEIVKTTTYTINSQTGQLIPNETTQKTDKVNTVITKGTKTKVEETKIPKVVKYVADENKEYGSENEILKIGEDGKTTKTTTYNLDTNTGIVTENQPVTSTENATEEIIKVGTKPTKRIVAEELTDNDFETQNDSTIPLGEVIEIPGKNGERTFTDTYTLDENTGVVTKIEDTVGRITKEKVKKIIKIGTGQNIVTPRNTVYKANPEKELGFEEETDAGEDKVVDVQGNVISSGRDRVITKGTKPTTETTEQNYTTRYVADNTKDRNYRSETGGVKGTTSLTTTYKVNTQTGEVTAERGEAVVVRAVEKVITVGTKSTTETTEQNYTTRYVGDDAKDRNYRSETGGVKGTTSVTTTYKVNPQTGEVKAERGEAVVVRAVEKVITVGTKPTTETTEQNYTTRYVGDDTKDRNYRSETGGVKGTTSVTTTYKVNPQTGEVKAERGEAVVVSPVEKVITVGTKSTTETTEQNYTTRYVGDDAKDRNYRSETGGVKGTTSVTTTYKVNTQTGEVTAERGEAVVVSPVEKVITVGTKPTTETTEQNFTTRYVGDNTKDRNYRFETGGVKGTTSLTTTYKVNTQTGEVTAERGEVVVVSPVEKVITVGTKPKVERLGEVEKAIQYIGEENTTEQAGTELERTQGSNGYIEKTTSYELDATNGVIIEKITEKVINKIDEVVKISIKPKIEETVINYTIRYIEDNTKEEGTVEEIGGKTGLHRVITTYKLLEKTGELLPKEDITIIPAEEKVIIKGTKKKDVTNVVEEITSKTEPEKTKLPEAIIQEEKVPFDTIVRESAEIEEGREIIEVEGQEGLIIKVTIGNETTIIEKILKQDRIVVKGTKKKVEPNSDKGTILPIIDKDKTFNNIVTDNEETNKQNQILLDNSASGKVNKSKLPNTGLSTTDGALLGSITLGAAAILTRRKTQKN